ncbi:calcium-binding protein p22-like protein [Dermatophagoides farinae]|uniref:Calcium-binding protein p22-like protein n=1 Tax=Dermatophagoides farinae TaxID=6954 RepID=A0A9D4SL02_DERFA|nr:calcium-binding protein p22-like protein [Dermatophagoides farinae]
MGNKSSLIASQIERLYSRFTSLDKGDNGTLGREDFLRIPELAINPLGDRIVQAFFSETDSFDDRINFRQFMRILARFRPIKKNREIKLNSREDKLRFAFKMYDLDGDEKISRDELLAVLHMMVGSNISTEQLANIADRTIMEADKDGDQCITFSEFCKTLERTDVEGKMSIRLPNDEFFEIDLTNNENVTAEDLIKRICENHYKIHIDDDDHKDYNVLAIWITNIETAPNQSKLQLPLNRKHRLIEMKEKFKELLKTDEIKSSLVEFRLGRNGYLSIKDEEKINNAKVLQILYLEARDNVKKNIYPLDITRRVELCEIELRAEYYHQKSVESVHSITSNFENDFYKTLKIQAKNLSYQNSLRKTQNYWKMTKNAKKACMTLEKCIEKSDVVDSISRDAEWYIEYLRKCRESIPCYGGFFFEAQMERSILEALIHANFYDKKILIGINEKGLHLINIECPKIISSIQFSDLSYGILKPKKDHHQGLIIKTKDDKVQQIFTRQASFIEKTLTQFIEGAAN